MLTRAVKNALAITLLLWLVLGLLSAAQGHRAGTFLVGVLIGMAGMWAIERAMDWLEGR